MNKKILAAGIAAAVFVAGAAAASEPTDMDGAKTANGKLILEYFNKRFRGQCKTTETDKEYYHAKVIEHGWLGMNAVAGAPGANAGAAPKGAPGGAAPGGGAPPAGAPPAGGAPQGAGAPPAGMAPGGGTCPNAEILKLVVQGDLVFVQAHGLQSKPNGDLLWILYRVKDGKIIEHWDTHNEIPDAQAGKQW